MAPTPWDGAGSLFALGLRLGHLDAAGAPRVGPTNGYKTDALVTIGLGLELREGEEVEQLAGDGSICVYYKAPDTLKRGTIAGLEVCTPDPNVLEFVQGGGVYTTPGTAEVQTVTITGGPAGGTFTLTYSAQTTAGIAYNANAAAVQSALEALSNLAPGDLVVTGGPGPATPYVVTFAASLGNVDQMTANGAGLTGGVTPAVGVVTTTPGVNPETIGYKAPLVGAQLQPNGISIEFWTRAVMDGSFPANLPYIQWVVPRAYLTPDGELTAASSDPMKPAFTGWSNQNANWGDGLTTGDWPLSSDRVWQWARVATVPDLTPGFIPIV
jgi:hypothetical protein